MLLDLYKCRDPVLATVSVQTPSCVSTTTTFSTGPATYCTCGETMAALYTRFRCLRDEPQSNPQHMVRASVGFGYSHRFSSSTANAIMLQHRCISYICEYVSATNRLLHRPPARHRLPVLRDRAAPSAGYHDIPDLLGEGTTTLDVVWVTIITTRQGFATATFSFDASTDACLSNMGAITSACAQGGLVTAPSANSCFDFGVSAQLVSNS